MGSWDSRRQRALEYITRRGGFRVNCVCPGVIADAHDGKAPLLRDPASDGKPQIAQARPMGTGGALQQKLPRWSSGCVPMLPPLSPGIR